jgi:NAD(P)-dependent dehydrogenase (short-subunit alcohol dehydrogenase family)
MLPLGRANGFTGGVFSLLNKFALVTGAGSGIGASIAKTFAQAGAHVFVTDRDAHAGSAVTREISESGGNAEFLSLDIASEAGCEAVARGVLDSAGRLDILVNNAGIGHVGTAATTSGEDFDRIMAVNVRGVFNVTRAFLPSMLARRHGVIVNLASIGALVGVRDRFAYTVSKHAVAGITRAMALDHAREGIRVNAICPGRVETPFVAQRIAESSDPAAARAEMISTQPMGRMGLPMEIAAAALYLASDEAAFVTGSMLCPDGGWSAG